MALKNKLGLTSFIALAREEDMKDIRPLRQRSCDLLLLCAFLVYRNA